jgi:ubiquitin-conjugating enzyme E2 S
MVSDFLLRKLSTQKSSWLSQNKLLSVLKKLLTVLFKNNLGVKVIMNEADLSDIQAEITGPVGTPYENGLYRCKLTV